VSLFQKIKNRKRYGKNDDPIAKRVSIISGAIIVILALTLLFAPKLSGVKAKLDDEKITVSSLIYKHEIKYQDIQSLSLTTDLPSSSKVMGINSPIGGLDLGSYKCSEYGTYNRFTYNQVPAFIVIKYNDTYLVFNQNQVDTTQSLYQDLCELTNLG
jgi:hypothetical protein